MTKQHVHANEHPYKVLDSGNHYEVCECGASRKVMFDGTATPWHECERCTHPWGRAR
jgi:CDGSH-type Zn-finger protein